MSRSENEYYCPIMKGPCHRTKIYTRNAKLAFQYPLTYDPDISYTEGMCGGGESVVIEEDRRWGDTVRSYPGSRCDAAVRKLRRILQTSGRAGTIVVEDIYTLNLIVDGEVVATINSGELSDKLI